MLIRKSVADDFEAILAIINDAARAYRGVIPEDRRWMSGAPISAQPSDM